MASVLAQFMAEYGAMAITQTSSKRPAGAGLSVC
jgi:hypothetical protein